MDKNKKKYESKDFYGADEFDNLVDWEAMNKLYKVGDRVPMKNRINKTKGNLEIVWKHLDEATGSLYNAFDYLDNMVDLGSDSNFVDVHSIKELKKRIDPSKITNLKNLIERLIEEKK